MIRQSVLMMGWVLFAGVTAFSVAHYATCRRSSAMPLEPFTNIKSLTRELDLTDLQIKEIAGLKEDLIKKLHQHCLDSCRARRSLIQAMAAEEVSKRSMPVEDCLKLLCQAYERGERATISHLAKIRSILDQEQRTRFDAMLQRCLCESCDEGSS